MLFSLLFLSHSLFPFCYTKCPAPGALDRVAESWVVLLTIHREEDVRIKRAAFWSRQQRGRDEQQDKIHHQPRPGKSLVTIQKQQDLILEPVNRVIDTRIQVLHSRAIILEPRFLRPPDWLDEAMHIIRRATLRDRTHFYDPHEDGPCKVW